jgi:hypothetical protein
MATILKSTKVNRSGPYKVEVAPYLNFEVNIICRDPSVSTNPTITKTIFCNCTLGHMNFEALHNFTNRERALGIPKLLET